MTLENRCPGLLGRHVLPRFVVRLLNSRPTTATDAGEAAETLSVVTGDQAKKSVGIIIWSTSRGGSKVRLLLPLPAAAATNAAEKA